ncbi:hypothetical protein Taro_047676 [Colocasia esculenta]|uniref:Uncharacterized protein n=1 Tax=Colocasia esculenta TaxID=4460 RepID=A0A843X7Z8_COLES|nr:hypothetical protein [Colocasia esculenta]
MSKGEKIARNWTIIYYKGGVDTPHTGVDTMFQAPRQKMKKWSTLETSPRELICQFGTVCRHTSWAVPEVDLQESLGLVQTGREVGEMADEQLDQMVRWCRETLAGELGAQADLDLRRFLTFFLGRLLFSTRGDAVHCRFLPLLEDLDKVWTYLHLPGLGRGILEQPSLVPLARRWVPCRDTHPLEEQLASIQNAIDVYTQLNVVWQPYLEEGDEGQP